MEIKTLLKEEVASEIQELHKMEVGSEQYKTTVEGLVKLTDRVIEMEKIEDHREDENVRIEMHAEEIRERKIDNAVKNTLTGVGILANCGLAVWGTCKSLKFEETGTITTGAGKEFFKKLFNFKKQ